jgi:hypothetical protein
MSQQRGRRSPIYDVAVTADGRGLPVTIEQGATLTTAAGMQPDRLDAAIDGLVRLCEEGAELLDEAGPMVRGLMQQMHREASKSLARIEKISAAQDALTEDEQAKVIPGLTDMLARNLDVTNKVTTILDRVNKMLLNAVKAKDVAVRLRTFIATGDGERHGLEDMSENALRRLVNATANGDQLPAEERRG